jgi:hypothetical protein
VGKKGVRKIDIKRKGQVGQKAQYPTSALGRSKPEKPPPPPPSTWSVTFAGDAPPLDVVATTAVISTAGVLAFKGGPDGQKLLCALAAGEWQRVELVNDAVP